MERKMLLALCLSPHDVGHGIELMKLWSDLEDTPRTDISAAICLRFDMRVDVDLQAAIDYLGKKFKVYVHVSRRKAKGWPAGCNGLELDAYEWFMLENRARRIDIPYIFILEADTLPLSKHWATWIMNEAYDSKANILGAMLFPPDCPCTHINANCVMHRDLWKKIRKIFHSKDTCGWDAFIGPEAIQYGTASRLIWQDYRLGMPDNPWRGDDYLFDYRTYQSPRSPIYNQPLKPAMLHGVKILQGIEAVRRKLLTSEVVSA